MGLFSGSRSTSTQTTNLNDYTTNNSVGGSVTGGYQPISVSGAQGPVTIEATDFRAVEAGTNLAREALARGASAFETAAAQVSSNANAIVGKTLGIAQQTQVSESSRFQDTLLKLALIVAAGVGLVAFAKRARA